MLIVLGLTVVFLSPNISYALDHYDKHVDVSSWYSYKIAPGTALFSANPLPKSKIRLYRITYRNVKREFFKYTGIRNKSCSYNLNIRIVAVEELSDRVYFPYESDYTEGTLQVKGRYFRNSNTMYMIPYEYYWNWKAKFAHELAHHFFDACGVRFVNNDVEHEAIHPFEEKF